LLSWYAALQYRNRVSHEIGVDQKFERLQDAFHRDNEKDILEAVWSFSTAANNWKIADEVVERLLALLTDEGMYRSPFAGSLLQFFEAESNHLTDHQKWLCVRFLNEQGDNFQRWIQFADGWRTQVRPLFENEKTEPPAMGGLSKDARRVEEGLTFVAPPRLRSRLRQ
jgi:hypothetical protein